MVQAYIADAPADPIESLKAVRVHPSVRPSVVVGAVLIAFLATLWVLLGCLTHKERGDTIDDARRELSTLANSYADYAAAVAEVGFARAPEYREIDPQIDGERLDAFSRSLVLPQGANVRLWSERWGWIEGGIGRRDPELGTPDRAPPGTLFVWARRAGPGIVAVATWKEVDALAGWRGGAIAMIGGLAAVSLLVGALAVLLIRQLRQRERAEARWRALLDHANDIICLIRVERDGEAQKTQAPRFLLEAINPSGAQTWKLSERLNAAGDRDLANLISAPVYAGVARELRVCLAKGKPHTYEVGSLDGSIALEATAVPVRDRGSSAITHLVVTGRDITDRKRREEQLRDALRQAETASRAKSQFLANMSHELRTPLNAILGFADMLSAGPDAVRGEKRTEYVSEIRQSGAHLLRVINDVLDLARIEAGEVVLQESECDPADVVRRCGKLLAPQAAQRGAELSAHAAPDLPAVLADCARLKQILLHLASNALKFSGSGGKVALSARRDRDGSLCFAVSDNGPGMDADEIATALEAFGQVDGGLSRRHEGMGLGLPLAQRLCALHGGALELASEKGSGTTVTVRLPASRVLEPERIAS